MYTSKALYIAAALLAFISIYSTFSGYYLTTVKFSDSSSENLQDSKKSQWFAPKGKVVMLLVDSLRFDYFVDDETIIDPKLKANKFNKFNQLKVNSPNNTLVIRAKSEAPTLTIERLPCLVTGNIPPKANMLLAFGALPLSEDSILRQLKQSGRKIYFSGDPLWTEMFPNDFTEANNIRSFDLKDQDVDNVTAEFIHKKLDENNFDLILGHMLGVDHMGHSYGVADPRVAKILNRIDNFIMEIIEKMDDETTLIVLGDHGMTNEGEHGHGSPKELDTAIAAYNKKGFQKFQQTGAGSLMKSIKETMTPVKQVDIAATLSMLLGVPVPFSNMGQIIDDLYPVMKTTAGACPEANFLIQMVKDNYLNSLQIVNYFDKYQHKTHLFEKHDVKAIKSMHKEIRDLHTTVMDMVSASKQCDPTFANIAIDAVAKSQNFSDKVYTIVKDTSSYDLPLIYQGTGILLLAAISYILTIQYLYRHGTNEIDLKFGDKEWLISALKKSKIYLATLLIVYCATYYFKNRMIHSVATSTLYSGFWLCGAIITISFGSNKGEKTSEQEQRNRGISLQSVAKNASEDTSNSNSDPDKIDVHDTSRDQGYSQDEVLIHERDGETFSSSGFFVFKTPLYTTIAIFAVVTMMICVHTTKFQSWDYHYIQPSAPYIVVFLLGLRLGKTFLRQLNLAFPLGIIISGSLLLLDVTLSTKGIRIVLGLLMVLDFVIHEVSYIVQHLKTKKAWGIAQFACFAVLVIYQLIPDRESYWVEIFLPRVVWAILLGIVILRYAFKIEGSAVERNFQLCLVQFLLLLQAPNNVFEFGYLLTIMRITAFLFTKAKVSNYLFSLVIAIWSHFGLFMFGHNDRWIPSKFTAGFIGLEKFNIVVSPLFVLLSILSSYVLGVLIISYYNNGIAASTHHHQPESSDLEKQKEGAINEISKRIAVIIQKRNVFPFVLIFNIVFLGAIIKAYVNLHFYFNESIEKFMIDATIYSFTMSCAYFLL